MAHSIRAGDRIIYRLTKRSLHPGPRAREVYPEPRGDGYTYEVDKFWVVTEQLPDGTFIAVTRRGKVRHLSAEDPNLRPARWWERLLFASRFPKLGVSPAIGS